MPRTIKHNRFQTDPYATKGRYIHREGPHAFHAYEDGWSQGRTRRTYSAAADNLFPARGHGGYSLSYYPLAINDDGSAGDTVGDELCAACARDEWLANPHQQFAVESSNSDRKYESPAYCDNCGAIIEPQACPHCGDDLTEPPTYPAQLAPMLPNLISDYRAIHARCMADLIAHGRARKVAKGTYDVPGSTRDPDTGYWNADGEWFSGTYRTPREEERRTEHAIAEYNARQSAEKGA